MSWRWVPLPISFRLSSRSSAKMSLRSSSMAMSLGADPAAGGGEDSIYYRLIAGAAADVAGDRLDDLVAARRRIAVEQRLCGHQHARRAIAALRGKMVREGALQRMQVRTLLDAVER